jgi:hypothetical protein
MPLARIRDDVSIKEINCIENLLRAIMKTHCSQNEESLSQRTF